MVWGKRMGVEEGEEEEERKIEEYCFIQAYIAGIPRQLFWSSGYSIELFFSWGFRRRERERSVDWSTTTRLFSSPAMYFQLCSNHCRL